MPPFALIESKYAFAPRATDAYAAAGPVSGEVPPSRIVLEVIPGSALEPARPTGSTIRARAHEATRAGIRLIRKSPPGSSGRTRVAPAGQCLPCSPKDAADALRQEEHQQDEHDAVDDRGRAGFLRAFRDEARQPGRDAF